jgi:hypothetical protein
MRLVRTLAEWFQVRRAPKCQVLNHSLRTEPPQGCTRLLRIFNRDATPEVLRQAGFGELRVLLSMWVAASPL